MIKRFKHSILVLAVMSTSMISCKKFLDVNENPNNPVNVPVEQLLPNVLVSSVNIEVIGLSNSPGSSGSLNQLGSVWAGYWSKATDGPSTPSLFRLEETYGVEAMANDRDGRPFWEDIYSILNNYRNIQTKAEESGDVLYSGIAKIMQGWHFMRLVDLYNNVPFDDALQGTVKTNPRFEPGEQVYEKSIDLITEGITDIKSANAFAKKPAADDVVFRGNMIQWIQFANTIKLRGLLRMSQLDKQAYINSEIAKINAEGSGFLGVHAAVNPGYISGTSGMQNPLWETYYRNAQGALTTTYNTIRPTEFLINEYKRLNDPRLELIYVPAKNSGTYAGVPLGSDDLQYSMDNTSPFRGPNENNNQPAGLFKSAVQASILMSSFESLFLQAEAAERGWISGSAKDLYESAIAASFSYIGTAAPASYFDQESVDLDQAPNRIARIIEQKWLALNTLSGFEAWSDYRRLGVPAIPQSLASPNMDPSYRPLRLTYRQSEISGNGDEVSKQGPINPFQSTVFWDK
ncbi:MAG TPA: SusD/RagB family nutrient-binding outer membrane lipoprotein [Flavihumibacter sp.]